MNLDSIFQDLSDLATCGDPTFGAAAQYIGQIAQEAQAGSVSPEELVELLEDVRRQTEIAQDMSQLAMKEKLHTCINGIITIAGAV